MGEGFVGGEAEAGVAHRQGEGVAASEVLRDFHCSLAHAEEHGDSFVDGAGRKLVEPAVADAPGRERCDAEGKIRKEFFADFDQQIAIQGVFA